MSAVYLNVTADMAAAAAIEADIRRISAYKECRPADRIDSDWATVALYGRERGTAPRIARLTDGSWLCHAGCWIHRGGIRAEDDDALLARYMDIGATQMAKELEGVFTIFIGDARTRTVSLVTDTCGSMHVYARQDAPGTAFCTSSLALSPDGKLDPVGLHEFVATGVIYEERSLWRGIRKLPPATVFEVAQNGTGIKEQRYWRFSDIEPESLGLDAAADALNTELVAALSRIGSSFPLVAADLTGGYDSRILLCGLLGSGIEFQSTVSGPKDSPDVQVARQICARLGRTLLHSQPSPQLEPALFQHAIRLADGECDIFDTARILFTHEPASLKFGASLNGSFGELARGYWWELLWPNLASSKPLDTNRVARKRFAAFPYQANIFAASGGLPLAQHMGEVANRAIADVRHLPNTSQMDALYFTLRMQRWQGRIASTTNQIWPAISPLASTAVLAPILSAQASTRFRSLLPRAMFAQRNKLLASIPLEHGYPPCPAHLGNLHLFWPVATHYGAKVVEKLRARLLPPAASASPPSANDRYAALFKVLPVNEWLSAPRLLETGLFEEKQLRSFVDPSRPIGGGQLEQWHRLASVECSLRAHTDASSVAA